MSKPLPWVLEPGPASTLTPLRLCTGRALERFARQLWRLSRHMRPTEPARPADPVLEFYAEAGAPEGALYVDGVRVGTLAGVQRL